VRPAAALVRSSARQFVRSLRPKAAAVRSSARPLVRSLRPKAAAVRSLRPQAAAMRSFLAPNASPMTLDGTRTYVIGVRRVAILDPGSAADSHIEALARAVADADVVTILVTHDHPDHSTGAGTLAARLGTAVRSIAAGCLRDGDGIDTDEGEIVTLHTPGHCPDHAAFQWPAESAIFCGDLMMGGLDTAVVAAPEGDVGAYLESLERLRSLRPKVIYPSHGPEFTDPDSALTRYVEHRRQREAQVLDAIGAGASGVAAITDHVYGDALDPRLRSFAEAAVVAYLEHLRRTDRLRP
jgi:glyoxylase-like metal-dependent hydrolase (beta-lactamase superfamily II)